MPASTFACRSITTLLTCQTPLEPEDPDSFWRLMGFRGVAAGESELTMSGRSKYASNDAPDASELRLDFDLVNSTRDDLRTAVRSQGVDRILGV